MANEYQTHEFSTPDYTGREGRRGLTMASGDFPPSNILPRREPAFRATAAIRAAIPGDHRRERRASRSL
jgi:hypothetical protein